MRGYIVYRAALAGVTSLAGIAVAVPLSGLSPGLSPALVVGIVLAAASASLVVLAVAVLASNKVEALAILKAAGAVSVLLPILAWTLPTQATWALLLAPPTWALFALPGYPTPDIPLAAILLAGLTWTLALATPATRHTQTRLES